jgi:hypothetical protein
MAGYWFFRFGGGPQVVPEVPTLPETFWVEPYRLLEGNLRDWEIKQKLTYRGFPHWRPDTRILGEPFTPLDIADLAIWLDASQITGLSDGEAVATWSDSSGNGNDFAQGTAGFRPIYKEGIIGNRPVVRFDNTDDVLQIEGLSLASPNVVFAVVEPATIGVQRMITDHWGGASVPGQRHIFWREAVDDWRINGGAQFGGGTVTADPFILMGKYDATDGQIRENGSVVVGPGNTGNSAMESINLGADSDGNRNWDGDIAEFIIYNRGITADEITQVEAYLSAKYSITLA